MEYTIGGSFIWAGCDCNCVGTVDVDGGKGTSRLSCGFDVKEMDGVDFMLFIAAERFSKGGVLTGRIFMLEIISEDGVCNIEEFEG